MRALVPLSRGGTTGPEAFRRAQQGTLEPWNEEQDKEHAGHTDLHAAGHRQLTSFPFLCGSVWAES